MAREGCFVHDHSAVVELDDLQISTLNGKTVFQILGTLGSFAVCNYWLDKKETIWHTSTDLGNA